MHLFVLLHILLLSIQYCICELPRYGVCRRQPLFNNKLMTSNMIIRHDDVTSLSWCAVACFTDENCNSFFYNKGEKFCQLHGVLFISPDDASDHSGTGYFEITQDWCSDKDGFILHRSPPLCYKAYYDPGEVMNYDQAKAACTSEGATLMKVKDADISFHMFEFLRGSSNVRETHFLIGADDLPLSGQYTWVDGDPVTWTNWASGEPSDPPGERCLAMAWFFYFKWNDVPCSTAMNFICQMDQPSQ